MEKKVCQCCGRELTLDHFIRRTFGESKICKECNASKISASRARNKRNVNLEEEIEKAKKYRLSEFTPRELMEELAQRGYKGKLTFTRIEEINIENF